MCCLLQNFLDFLEAVEHSAAIRHVGDRLLWGFAIVVVVGVVLDCSFSCSKWYWDRLVGRAWAE